MRAEKKCAYRKRRFEWCTRKKNYVCAIFFLILLMYFAHPTSNMDDATQTALSTCQQPLFLLTTVCARLFFNFNFFTIHFFRAVQYVYFKYIHTQRAVSTEQRAPHIVCTFVASHNSVFFPSTALTECISQRANRPKKKLL